MTKLWKVSRTDRIHYDQYDSMVVAADNEIEARNTHPNGTYKAYYANSKWGWFITLRGGRLLEHTGDNDWTDDFDSLKVEYLGATERDIKGVILSSYNAG